MSKIKLPEEQRMDEKKIINGVSAEQIAGSDGRDPSREKSSRASVNAGHRISGFSVQRLLKNSKLFVTIINAETAAIHGEEGKPSGPV